MESLIEQLREKLQEKYEGRPLRLWILTPCYGAQLGVNYVRALIETRDLLLKIGVEICVEFCHKDSLVTRARNNLVAKAMADPSMTHVMFIDADIGWNANDVLRLLFANKGLVGGIYPLKSYSWSKLVDPCGKLVNPCGKLVNPCGKLVDPCGKLVDPCGKLVDPCGKLVDPNVPALDPSKNIVTEGNASSEELNEISRWLARHQKSVIKDVVTPVDFVKHHMVLYNVNLLSNHIEIVDSLAEVRHIPTGFMMIKRETIAKLFANHSVTKYTDDVGFLKGGENDFAYALFDCAVVGGHYYSEDWLFCHRWMELGEKVYMDVGIRLIHSGQEDYDGFLLSTLV